MRRGRVAGALAAVAALGLLLTGCGFVDQYRQAVDDLSHGQELLDRMDSLVSGVRELDGVEDASADSRLGFAPYSADLTVRMDADASVGQWRAVADTIMTAATGDLDEVELAVVQRSEVLHVDYPADADAAPAPDVELAARLGEAIGPGLQFSLIRAAPAWSRVVGAIDRGDTATTRAFVANATAVRAALDAAPERGTQWLLPGLSFTDGLPPDAVLALVGDTSIPLPPNALPGDETVPEMPDESVWFGYHHSEADDTVVIGLLLTVADAPQDAAHWREFAALVREASAAVDGVLVVNVMGRDGGGVVTRTDCTDGTPTSGPDDAELASALADAGIPRAGFIPGYCTP
ncbi:hypothetical protein D7I47_04895 [Protaetiibacter intestinalis]|uniref:Uncharacterized protein n=2 Tax=Protaetiibacter intestinalis TaxID=2419774 RepID=A0A387B7B2_9MICO|nr:hypothetical protein D7I47_04895 [Protaetiibacter intestinalis]